MLVLNDHPTIRYTGQDGPYWVTESEPTHTPISSDVFEGTVYVNDREVRFVGLNHSVTAPTDAHIFGGYIDYSSRLYLFWHDQHNWSELRMELSYRTGEHSVTKTEGPINWEREGF